MAYHQNCVSLLIAALIFFPICTSKDTITPVQSVRDGETLVSADENFVLGFFSPGKSKNRYIGIWLNKIPNQTVVWVANRENPVSDSSGILKINGRNLVLVGDGGMRVNNPMISGYTYVSNDVEIYFKFTINDISIMEIAILNVLGVLQRLRSRVEPTWSLNKCKEECLKNCSCTAYASANVSGEGDGCVIWYGNLTDVKVYSDQGQDLYTRVAASELVKSGLGNRNSHPMRVYLTRPTTLDMDSRSNKVRASLVVVKLNMAYHQIFQYLLIAALIFFPLCSSKDTITPIQSVRDGETLVSAGKNFALGFFSPENSKNRYIGIWFNNIPNKTVVWVANRENPVRDSSGILTINAGNLELVGDGGMQVRNPIIEYTYVYNDDEIYYMYTINDGSIMTMAMLDVSGVLQRLKWTSEKPQWDVIWVSPQDRSRVEPTWSLIECKEECLKNCSCTAYATANVSGEGGGCVLWYGNLTDVKVYSDQGQDLYIRVAASELDENSNRYSGGSQGKKKLLVTLLTVISVALLSCFCGYCWWKKAKGYRMNERRGVVFNNNGIEENGKGSELSLFSFSVIVAITNNFSESNMLGKGGFGPVYKIKQGA
ncbi:S-locus glycoprotein [Cinnamomum micranthum f. kanehirae]|uniref:S-locus glycoprotein n=1 Tax=Cinnamomum micranthum f. kanehirae TaxID=337451 RepID=A0A3S3PD86_9MAGN|nr:S-locus glycoprotein [Cinnamomum micranthum f. kanehirae]